MDIAGEFEPQEFGRLVMQESLRLRRCLMAAAAPALVGHESDRYHDLERTLKHNDLGFSSFDRTSSVRKKFMIFSRGDDMVRKR